MPYICYTKSAQMEPCRKYTVLTFLPYDTIMKSFYIGLFLSIFFYLPAGAQKYAPTGILNSHSYTDKEEFDNTNYSYTFVSSSGKVYTSPYGTRQILVIGNNYTHTVTVSKIHPFDLVDGFAESPSGEIWVYQRSQMSVLHNDTLVRSIKYPKGEILFSVGNTNYLESEKGKSIYYCDGYTFTKIFSSTNFPDSGDIRLYIDGDSIFVYCQAKKAIHIYAIYDQQKVRLVKSIENQNFVIRNIELLKSNHNWCVYASDRIYCYKDFKPNKSFAVPQLLERLNKRHLNYVLTKDGNPKAIFALKDEELVPVGKIDIPGKSRVFLPDAGMDYKTFYAYGSMQPARAFSYIKKYPDLYKNANAVEVFSLAQDNNYRIWAASYQGKLSIIEPDIITEVPINNLHFLSGNMVAGDKVLFFAEGNSICTLLYDMKGKTIKRFDGFGGFIGYLTPGKSDVYFGMGQYNGIWHTNITSLAGGNPKWDTIGVSKGVNFNNIISITSDTLGRIWYGQRGFGVYDSKTGKAETFKSGEEINFYAISMLTDNRGTVWLGSNEKGLLYYDTYTNAVKPADIKRLIHPLLPDKRHISSLCAWGNWLVIGTENKILLLDLKRWYKDKGIIIRYLNPQEAAFTGKVEQNIFLIDKRDSTLWFSTSDMLYQWDIKTWLSLPIYKVAPNVVLKKGKCEFSLAENQLIKIEPTQNTFSLQIWFQSRDNMPRYMSAALTLKGDSIKFPDPTLQTHFDYSNLAPGTYLFSVMIFQSDGTTSSYRYTIVVKKFWWQHIWVWILFALIVLIPIVLWQNGLRKTAILQKIKAEQDSKLANLQLVSLSSQFRPHFILNALNAIGAGSDDKPEQESILSRLGESVNLIFNHAKEQKTTHSFSNEWKLVLNVIEIHKLIYLKELRLTLPPAQMLSEVADIQVPLGLLQIPVENALLHGLNNRLVPPWVLSIDIEPLDKFMHIIITDNGVGRTKSATLSNFTKHGTGSKNLEEVVRILNMNSDQKIVIKYEDSIFEDDNRIYGTKVIIEIPKGSST